MQGVPVEVKTNTGYQYKNVKLIDFDNVENIIIDNELNRLLFQKINELDDIESVKTKILSVIQSEVV